MLLSQKQKAILAIIIAYIIGGATSPIFKWSLESIQPFTLGFLRFFIASIVILPFVANNLKLDRKSLPMLMLTTIVSIPLQVGLYLVGLQFAPSINVPIITASAPIFIIICAVLFLHEKKQIRIILGT
jgi:drug/metabolite transporter (DMT)-like permease